MSEEALRELERIRFEMLSRLPCVHCGVPAGDHTEEELAAHIAQDRKENKLP